VRRLGLSVTRQEQERAREALFAGVEELVDEVFFDADVSRQHVPQESIGEGRLSVELSHHLSLLHDDDRARRHGRRRCHPVCLPDQTPLTKKMARLQYGDDGLFSGVRQHGETDGAPLDVHDARRRIALSKDRCFGLVYDPVHLHVGPLDERSGFRRRGVLGPAHALPAAGGRSLELTTRH